MAPVPIVCPECQEVQPCKVRKTRGPASGRRVGSGAPELGHTLPGPGEGPGELCGWRRGQHIPVRPARALLGLPLRYSLAHAQRKSLQIPSFLPAAGGPPPAQTPKNGARLSLLPLPPLARGWGAGGQPLGRGALWGLQVLKALWGSGPSPACVLELGGVIMFSGAPEHPASAGPGPPAASTYPGCKPLWQTSQGIRGN